MEKCKLFTLTEKGVEEIEINLVTVEFKDSKPIYKLKVGNEDQTIVQSYNSKQASIKMLNILNERRRSK